MIRGEIEGVNQPPIYTMRRYVYGRKFRVYVCTYVTYAVATRSDPDGIRVGKKRIKDDATGCAWRLNRKELISVVLDVAVLRCGHPCIHAEEEQSQDDKSTCIYSPDRVFLISH